LPKDADGERISAEFKNGVLTISVPKRETVAPKEIEVRIA
jgi:HSP20 family molecular chaperone IbpA